MTKEPEKPSGRPAKKGPRWEVRILVERCKGCGFCVEFCGKEVLAISRSYNRKGYHPPEIVKADECSNCKVCEMLCPDFAIFIVPLKKQGDAESARDKSEVRVDPEEMQRRAAIES
jgi:2-oxoglutarate ferredoxin oxidoreductase subunit delta